MEPPFFGGGGGGNTPREEALRWLAIAEKLLTARDLVGSKSFATRARESDPNLIPAYQILAVVDTLIASEKRINNQLDWYAILQLGPGHDSELIATQYRRLAILLNPQKNKLPFADQAFRLVVEAWSVLSNPTRKRAYDAQVNFHFYPHPNPIPDPHPNPIPIPTAPTPQPISQPPPVQPAPPPPPPPPLQPQHQQEESQQSELPNDNDESPVPHSSNNESQPPNNDNDDGGEDDGVNNNGTFWTACPYCYHMYEYSKDYLECVLRCQKCRNAFQGVEVASPPLVGEGKDAYFCCWGYMPMGVSVKDLGRNGGGAGGMGSSWTPFSPMFTCPQMPGLDRNGNNVGGWRNVGGRKGAGSGPRIYIDDDDVFVEVSDPSEGESDDDWQKTERMKKKKAKSAKAKVTPTSTPSKSAKKPQVEKGKSVKGGSNGNAPAGFVIQEDVGGMVNVVTAESSKKGPASSTRRQSGRVATKDFGKLDLNVEFSNEVEEPAPRMAQGHGAGRGYEDNFEGTGFFEGLDEFLSSLPILNAVGGDDKVKAA